MATGNHIDQQQDPVNAYETVDQVRDILAFMETAAPYVQTVDAADEARNGLAYILARCRDQLTAALEVMPPFMPPTT